MKLERTIALNMSEAELFDRAADLLLKRGYHTYGRLDEIRFHRRHPLATWWAINAAMWPADVKIELEEGGARVTLSVSTSGNVVSSSDEAYWKAEFETILAHLSGEEPPPVAKSYLAKSFVENLIILVGALVLLYFITRVAGPWWGVVTIIAVLAAMYFLYSKRA